MIVAIDGPAGAGKSSVATEVARRLGFAFLDTGAMYRAVALAALEAGVDPRDGAALGRLARRLDIDVTDGRVSLGSRDVTDEIRRPEVTAVVSTVSASPLVRNALVERQRRRAAEGGIVVEGRDIGTVVFPDAEVKIFLTASLEARARRRLRQEGAEPQDLAAVVESIEARDEADRRREESPLVPARDAILIDTTEMSFGSVVDAVVRAARARGGRVSAPGRLPVVAVVGRPNVGKSSLVNRILGRREAIVEATPGVTRDRRSFVARWAGHSFELFDTGGLEPGADGLDARVTEQAQVAIASADVVVLVTDASSGPLEDDAIVARSLRRSGTPTLLAVNKVDDMGDEPAVAEFFSLGLGEPHPVSALHGRASGDLLDALVELLPETGGDDDGVWASAAVVGRPNVGKSSLLNALVGEDRAIVDPAPGTTRDPVDSLLDVGGRTLRLVDTAGMRRQVQIKDEIEYFGWLRSRRTLHRVDAAILVVDIAEGITGTDQRIASEVLEAGRACVVVLNKWDLLSTDEADRARLERAVTDRLRFVPWAKIVRTSATTRRGVDRVLPAVLEAVASHRVRLPTAEVNRIVRTAQERRPHPRRSGRGVRVLYAVQAAVGPPTIVLFTTGRLEPSYVRYIERAVRAEETFSGTPIRIEVRPRTRREVKA